MINSTTTQSLHFVSLPTTILGRAGEVFVQDWLRYDINYTIYWNIERHGSSAIDGFGFSGLTPTQLNWFEVKVKASKNKFVCFSIHADDCAKYKAIEEAPQRIKVLIIYLDLNEGEVYMTTPSKINSSIEWRGFDWREKKEMIYFKSFEFKTKIPETVLNEMRDLSIQSKTYNK